MRIMASGPITSWQIDRETMETVTNYLLGLQNHCRWWLQPWNWKMLTLWKESYDQPRQHIKKQRHYFANIGPCSQSYCFSSGHVWMWQLDYKESWAPKNWCFWTVVLEMIPWTARGSNQSIPKEISPEYSLDRLMLKLKLQYFGHLIWRADSLEKTWMLGKTEGRRRRGWQRMGWLASPTQWIWVWASSGRWWRTGRPGVLQSMGSQRVRHNWATEQQQISLSLWHYSACWCIYLSTKWVNA